ncbi:hypothetical protein PIB30_096146, partial [Stylosanthes scabra]|nr:hypothetical protein [Stylosanthes scabra]
MRRTLRICVGVSLVCRKWIGQDGWQGRLGLWLARICVEVTHMRGEPEPGSQ